MVTKESTSYSKAVGIHIINTPQKRFRHFLMLQTKSAGKLRNKHADTPHSEPLREETPPQLTLQVFPGNGRI